MEKISSWNGLTVHVCCFMLARASTETFVSRVQKTAKKSSLAGSLVSRGITVLAIEMMISGVNGFLLIAAHEFDARRRMISKTFYQQLRSSERQSLVGPPESMREHVVAASKAMRNGNWSACKNFIINEKMNAKVMLISLVTCLHSSSSNL
jgi:hypothetical protein